jgi:hypothetical protein
LLEDNLMSWFLVVGGVGLFNGWAQIFGTGNMSQQNGGLLSDYENKVG